MISIKVTQQDNDIYTMQMKEQDKILCVGSIRIGQACEIISISQLDEIYGYAMCKALLNLADRKGVGEVVCKNEKLFEFLENLGFKKDKNITKLSLKGYFSSRCKK